MMFYPPFYRYPYNRTYWKYPHAYLKQRTEIKEEPSILENNYGTNKKKETRNFSDSPFIEIFGISLYFDDILLISLLLFLFQEGVDDEWLYIALILLLFS